MEFLPEIGMIFLAGIQYPIFWIKYLNIIISYFNAIYPI